MAKAKTETADTAQADTEQGSQTKRREQNIELGATETYHVMKDGKRVSFKAKTKGRLKPRTVAPATGD